MEKRWKFPQALSEERLQFKASILNEIKCPEMIADLLARYDFSSLEEIYHFFEPNFEQLHDPFLFKDMEKAVERIIRAVKVKEKITIYGDYDVDGTTSTALLYLGLSKFNPNVNFYIPHRMIDGYGISLSGVSKLKEDGTSLIISVDCGINGIEEVDEINQLGMEIIITDHHNPREVLPKAYAIINPKLEGCGYPFEFLAGVGVAFKLLSAVYQRLDMADKESILEHIDLVGIGTIADIVPLVGENRVIAFLGLQQLMQKQNKGLNALINLAGLSAKELNSTDIIFGLAPRINAAGRMGSAVRAVELMICEDEEKAIELSEIIERENSMRQQEDQRTFEEACEIIEKKYKDLRDTYCMVISSDNWHPGVIGIVASKLVEKYYRPTFMITFKTDSLSEQSEFIGSGSGRSIADFDLFAALAHVEDLLDSFGGHKYAAGLSIPEEYVDRFEIELSKYTKSVLTPDQLVPPMEVDHEIELYEISEQLLDWLDRFAPFGPKNMRPVFYTLQVMVSRYPYTVGRNHLKLRVQKDGRLLDLIGFNMGDFLPLLKKDMVIDIAYSLELNIWQDKKTIQGKLKDIHFSGSK